MECFQLHPEIYNQPIHLSPEEMSDPRSTLQDIFTSTTLCEMRQQLWKMVEACVGTPDPGAFETGEQRQDMLLTYQDIEKALEAGWLLCTQGKREKGAAPKK